MSYQIRKGWYAFDGFNPVTEKPIWVQPAAQGQVFTEDEAKKTVKELRRRSIKDIKIEAVPA